jgi:pimeloyl-ACP methyl ester carboxylesterase
VGHPRTRAPGPEGVSGRAPGAAGLYSWRGMSLETFLLVLAIPLALAFLTWAHLAYWGARYAPRSVPDEVHNVRTADGWRIGLRRYRPHGPGPRFEEPVILCHGLGANHLNMDFDPPYGLAQALAARGRDCFVLCLRGHDGAERPGPFNGLSWGFSFDDHARFDVPAALDHVLRVTGARRVQWVGHSMGGLLAYAQGGTEHEPKLAGGIVALGSPSSYADQPYLQRLTRLGRLVAGRRRVPKAWLTRLVAPLGGWVTPPFSDLVIAPGSVEGPVIRRLETHAFEDLSAGVLAQFDDWVHGDHFRSLDRSVDYQDALRALRVPVLVIGGSLDRMAPPACLRKTMERLQTADRELLLLGRDHGQEGEYGHGDLVFNRRAPREVYPAIAAWLERRAAPLPMV